MTRFNFLSLYTCNLQSQLNAIGLIESERISIILLPVSGLFIYVAYGVRHSNERRQDDQEVVLYDVTDTDSILAAADSRHR